MRLLLRLTTFIILIGIIFTSIPTTEAAIDLTTKYRVFQNDRLIGEYANKHEAINKAKWITNSYVENVVTREWIYHNFPRYLVYQKDTLLPKRFHTLNEAIREAKKWSYSSVRDVQKGGWVWDQYPRKKKYQVFQGETSLDHWQFDQINDALKEAKKWTNSHIIDLSNNTWIWDNLSETEKEKRRAGEVTYEIHAPADEIDGLSFAYIEDAILLASQVDGSRIVNTITGNQVYDNEKRYEVLQNRKPLASFSRLHEAIVYAKRWTNSSIKMDGREIWNNYNFYRVYDEHGTVRTSHQSITSALKDALRRSRATIRDYHGKTIWDNSGQMMTWAWTGSASDARIKEWVSQTIGLDIVSPTWFLLLNSNGELQDTSSKQLITWLNEQNIEVHPLVHNQFDPKLTTAFLRNEKAQNRFITELVNKSAALGVNGINVDFESISGSDRDAYTAFIQKLSKAAKDKGLKLSIDLPRGSIRWNHLSAYDHEKLADLVNYMMIMAYDQHWSSGSTAGSVAGFQWTSEGVEEFLSYGIPREKLMLGIPFYVREWKLDSNGKLLENRAIYIGDIEERLNGKSYTSVWDPEFEQYRIDIKENGFHYVFWLEDAETVRRRIQIAREERLGGIAAWRLGQESPDVWGVFAEEINK